MKFITCYNEAYGEEARLFRVWDDNSITEVMRGDAYHDKIEQKIDGFMEALDYSEIENSILSSWNGYVRDGFDNCDISFNGKDIKITCESCDVEEY